MFKVILTLIYELAIWFLLLGHDFILKWRNKGGMTWSYNIIIFRGLRQFRIT